MGSHPTLDQQDLAAEALKLDPDDWRHGYAVAHLAAEHPQVRAWPDGNPDLAHEQDHRDWIYDHHHQPAERAAERAFDRLNPGFGVPADRSDQIGHRDVAQREAALALGVRVAAHDSRQNNPNPVMWQPGQDYRMADALHAARTHPTRTRHGPSGWAPNANHTSTKEQIEHGSGQPHHHRREPDRGPRGPLHQHRDRRREHAGGRNPADPAGRGVARRRHLVPAGQCLAGAGRASGRLPVQGGPRDGYRAAAPAQLGDPEDDKRSVTEIEGDEGGASLKWATAKVERTSQRGNGDRTQSRERQAERSGDFNDAPPFKQAIPAAPSAG